MATRSRTRASAANVLVPQKATKPTIVAKEKVTPSPASQVAKLEPTKSMAKRGKGKAAASTKGSHCSCSQGDDGSPMIYCEECKIWYHFTCVEISERDAEDINLFICPSCSETTGLHSIMSWEGLDAFEDGATLPKSQSRSTSRTKTLLVPKDLSSDDSDGSGSEDEYLGEGDGHPKDRGKSSKKRRAIVSSSESESDSFGGSRRKRTRRLTKASTSPPPSRQLDNKRKASTSDSRQPSKKQKAESAAPTDDPTRKYCLGKLEDLFRDIFFRYPHVRSGETEDEEGSSSAPIVSKSLDDMSEAEKESLLEESKAFAAEIEKCIFEGYADVDKAGHASPGINYKDRFRTLQFNLSKPDRVFIHRRITSSNITPKELSGMSSTDLANEETQQEIKQAEQEALEHSILQKVVAPRAKITHKGLQDIEYHDEPTPIPAPSNDVQIRREVEAEERRERERFARLKPLQRQRTMSTSNAPESPVVPTTPTADAWGAPPPVPAQQSSWGEQSPSGQQSAAAAPSIRPDTGSRHTPEPEFNLADLINIEEVSPSLEAGTSPVAAVEQTMDMEQFPRSTTTPTTEFQSSASPTTISPFSHPSDKQSFSLSTLWNNSKGQQEEEDTNHPTPSVSTTPPPLSPPTMKQDTFEDDDAMVESPASQADDQDFDMFLQDKENVSPPSVEALPEVWTGKISMPLDSSIPQETPMVARQIAGTPLRPDSLSWKTLFPSDHLRIDGRVAVDSSAKYLMQMRLSSAKELYAVALSPASEKDEGAFKSLSDFLTSKGRHGLVFPWGSRPKDHHPGRELYVIPLGNSEPLPEYVELLDNLRLPKDRKRNYMIGIWILNKGKLAPPPTPTPTPPAPPSLPSQPTPQVLLQSLSSSLAPSIVPTFTPPIQNAVSGTSVPGMLGYFAPKPYVPTSMPTVASSAPAIDPAALAAEVASLTPEQIQGVLRTLQLSGASLQNILPGHAPVAPVQQTAYPPYIPPTQGGHGPQPWQAGTSPYPPGFPPYPGSQPPRDQGPHPPRPHPEDRYERNQQGDRDGQTWRGRGRSGRGRGRGGGDGLPVPGRPADSGWPRKAGKNSQHSNDSDRRW